MSRASHSVIEIARFAESLPINAKTPMFDHAVSGNSSALGTAFNNVINVCAILMLITILVFLELHIHRSTLHSHPAVVRNTNDAVPGISLHMPAQSNAVER